MAKTAKSFVLHGLFPVLGNFLRRAACATICNLFASQSISAERLKQYSDLAVQWEQEYLRIDTTNPPGNESRTAAFFKKIFDQEGIENRVFDYAAGHAQSLGTASPYVGDSEAAHHSAEPYGCGDQRRLRIGQMPLSARNIVDGCHLRTRRAGHEERGPGTAGGDGDVEAREKSRSIAM